MVGGQCFRAWRLGWLNLIGPEGSTNRYREYATCQFVPPFSGTRQFRIRGITVLYLGGSLFMFKSNYAVIKFEFSILLCSCARFDLSRGRRCKVRGKRDRGETE